jgi:hypothetical protein
MTTHGTAATGPMAANESRRETASNIDRVTGWWVFAGILLLISGTLNVIYGIAAISDSKFFTENATYILSNLNTWGWVTLILGALQITAGFSLFAGNAYGRWFGIFAASGTAIAALLSIPAYPLWSLAIFALAVIVIHQLATSGSARTA